MSQLIKRQAFLARSLMNRLNQSKTCCPHHAGGGSGAVCIARPNSNSSEGLLASEFRRLSILKLAF